METWRAARVPTLPGRGPEPHLVNTATGELTRAAPGARATLYACGITPYDATHIGHAATYLAWDLLVRAGRDGDEFHPRQAEGRQVRMNRWLPGLDRATCRAELCLYVSAQRPSDP